MIPTSFLSRLSLPSPQQTERDLARLIHRTIELDRRANRQLGYAAVNIGCDGVRRVTMFDGSSCQTSGDVCLATREEGITVCLDTPSGAGLAFQRIAFAAPACEPATGWWIVDAEGYLYRVPAGLITATPYWPMSADPAVPEPVVTLARAGTWARLMCGDALTIPLNGDGGAQWQVLTGEADWSQEFAAAVGGLADKWVTAPTVGVISGNPYTMGVTISGGAWILGGVAGSGASGYLSTSSYGMATDTEQYVAVSWDGSSLQGAYGAPAAIGAAAVPDYRADELPVGIAHVLWDASLTITDAVVEGAPVGDAILPPRASTLDAPSWRGVLLRDALAPNTGLRVVTVALPTAGTGIVTGDVRVAFGYPFGYRMSGLVGTTTSLKPYPREKLKGTWQADCVGRIAGDMSLCYRRGLAVEYGEGHLCLSGEAITDLSDYVSLDEIDQTNGPALDVKAGVVALPNGEIALFGRATGDLRTGSRYRVRPAPAAPLTIALSQEARGAWPDDPNLWVEESHHNVNAWSAGATTFTVPDSSASTFPNRPVACMLWESNDTETDAYPDAAVQYPCTLGPTSGGLTTLVFDPLMPPVAASSKSSRYLTVIGPWAHAGWGWTAEVLEDPDDPLSPIHETALSSLTDQGAFGYRLEAPATLYSVALTVPAGPAGTVRRHIYRCAWDYGSYQAGEAGPWSYGGEGQSGLGGLYDRMCRRIATIDGNTEETVWDTDTTLTGAGTWPPDPLIYLGPIVIDAPRPVHVLQPMEL
jgi:hypothetical protein